MGRPIHRFGIADCYAYNTSGLVMLAEISRPTSCLFCEVINHVRAYTHVTIGVGFWKSF